MGDCVYFPHVFECKRERGEDMMFIELRESYLIFLVTSACISHHECNACHPVAGVQGMCLQTNVRIVIMQT